MDYYGVMLLTTRTRFISLTAAIAVVSSTAWAQPTGESRQATKLKPEANSNLDGELFYEIFLGELSTRSGEPGAGYALMLEAARRTGSSQLYQRAADIALQSRSGEYALTAAKAWKEAQPESREANRYVLQILIALNRISDTPELLKQELAQSPQRSRVTTLATLPQMYGRASDKALAANIVEQALVDELKHPANGPVAWVTIGRMRLAAGDPASALNAARNAAAMDTTGDGYPRLALELMEDNVAQAEPLVLRYMAGQPTAELRMSYARVLLGLNRFGDASKQLALLTQEKPDFSEAWLVLATLQVQENQVDQAANALQRFMAVAKTSDETEANRRAFTQAYLLYSQIEEKRGNYAAAEDWLTRIDNASELASAQVRRASLLGRRGLLDQARTVLHNLPGNTSDEKKAKLLAEVALLREFRQYTPAYEIQTALVELAPDDNELVYEQAMLAEKAGKPDAMEGILYRLIEKQPTYHHAYNALGYSLAERGIRLEEAKRLILKALEYAPGDPFITDSLGWAEFRLGNKAEARKLLETAYKKRPDPEIAAHLGEVLWEAGDKTGARAIWREGLGMAGENETLKETLKRFGVQP